MPIDGAIIQQKVWRGYGIAGSKVGAPHQHFRPTESLDPLRLLNRIGTLQVALDARPSYKFSTPGVHGDWARYALVDGAALLPGDYLVGPQETVFVAAMPPLQPIVCCACNAVISMRRMDGPGGFGAIEDRSDVQSGEREVWRGWPCSLLFGGRGRGNVEDIPGDLPNPEYLILLPAIPGAPNPHEGDVVVDEHGRRLQVGWWEQSPLGWRILARLLTGALTGGTGG